MRGRPPKALQFERASAASTIVGKPKCPSSLGPIAKKKWRACINLMDGAGLLTLLDGDLLALYCEAFEQRTKALEAMGDEYTVFGKSGPVQNPLIHVANKALAQMSSLSKRLGLDKVSAKKLGVEHKKASSIEVKVRDRSKGPPPPPMAGKIGETG